MTDSDTQLLYDKKWHLLIKRAGIFKHIPFIDFVFGSGSLAIGNVDEESDFDVLVGVREGRIFTVRFLSALFLSVLRWRRAKEHGGKSAAN
jgi:predicted nucleotidyltransferase